MRVKQKAAKGLTMVELAVVLAIMGLIGTVFYGAISKFMGKLKQDDAVEQVLVTQEKFRGFVLSRSSTQPALPAADPGNLMPEELGDYNDPWGQRLHYHPATDLTANPIDDVNVTDLEVNFYTDGDLTTLDRSVANVAYVVISLGPNQQQDYRVGSVDVVSPDGTKTKADGSEFDDIVEYVTLPELKGSSEDVFRPGLPPSDYAYRLNDEEGGYAPGPGSPLIGSAAVGSVPGFPDITALDLTANDAGSGGSYLDLSGDDVNLIDFTEYTIMGWYKTEDTTIDDFATLTSRQNGADWDERTWWVTLWDDGFLGQGDGKTPGELVLKAQSQGGAGGGFSYFADSNYTNNFPADLAHHDAQWHFFAARMSADDPDNPTQYTSEAFVSDDRDSDGEEELLLGAETRTFPDPPFSETTYVLYIGYNPTGSVRYFRGYIDDIIIYDRALTDAEITTFFNGSKADHGY